MMSSGEDGGREDNLYVQAVDESVWSLFEYATNAIVDNSGRLCRFF